MKVAIAIGVVLSTALIVLCVVALMTLDFSKGSTDAIAIFFIPFWTFCGIVLIWSAIFLGMFIVGVVRGWRSGEWRSGDW